MILAKTFVPAIFALLTIAAPVSAQTWVTKRDVESQSGGYSFRLENGSRALIVEVRAPRGVDKNCRVHLPSVRRLASKEAEGKQAGIIFPVPLGFVGYNPDSAVLPGCRGPGTDCIVFVSVP